MKLLTLPYHYLKKLLKLLVSRPGVIGVLIIFQICLVIVVPQFLPSVNQYITPFFRIFSIVSIFWIVSKDENPYFKISWISLFFFFPVVGGIIYLMFANRPVPRKMKEYIRTHKENVKNSISKDKIKHPTNNYNLMQSNYIHSASAYPTMANTAVEYYKVGEDMYDAFLEDMKTAEKYIFMEFFIVAEGIVMDGILEVLKDRIAHGVNVFFMYDDIGSIFSAPVDYQKQLQSLGINVCIFNPFRPQVNPILNYRDHRKIIAIDGKIAYSGGMNLADEYINKKERFGHWKDTGVRLEGDGAWSFALMFVHQWRFVTGTKIRIANYMPEFPKIPNSEGFVQVYGDDPMEKHNIAEHVYLRAIWQAKRYIYITTPYLVIDNAMEGALCSAATSGVDVRIVAPYIFDKWSVHKVTRSHFPKLIKNGVKIYEYTPGFIHSKMFVSDDIISMVGTSNLDFRSFYHHFECSVLIYENEKIKAVKEDILDCIEISQPMTLEILKKQPIFDKIAQSVLKLFAPLL